MLTFDPYIPLALWVPLAVAAAGLSAAYAWASRGRLLGRRRGAILALMTVALAVPLAILLNPTWMDRVPPPPGKPLLTVLVDTSASMDVRDAPQQRSRYQEACRIARTMVKDLGDRYEVRLRSFAAGSSPTGIEALEAKKPEGAATDLAAAIDSALESEQPQGQAVLLLSDGGHNAGGTARFLDATARAKSQATPIFTHTIGGKAVVPDLAVEVQQPQELAFVRQQVPVVVKLQQRGSLAAQATLRLLLEGKEIEKRTARLVPNGTSEQVFNVKQDAAGLFRYEVLADRLPGEVTVANNTSMLLLRVVDQPVRVLLLEGKPYWDTKFLIRSLATDDSIELTAVVQLAEGRLLERKIARKNKTADDQWTIEKDAGKFLADRATLASYQIVILGRSAEVFLSDEALTRLTKWLNDDDGSLVCFRGAPSSKINQRLDAVDAGPLDGLGRDPLPRPVDRRGTGPALAAGRGRYRSTDRDARAGHDRPAQGQALRGHRFGDQCRWRIATRRRALGKRVPRAVGDVSSRRQRRQRPRGCRGRGRHVALGLPSSTTPGPRRTL